MKGVISSNILVLTCYCATLFAQNPGDYFLSAKQYPFIKYNKNQLEFPGNKALYEGLFSKLDSAIQFGAGKINIVHIGGSHIQADIYTHQIRKRLQSLQYDMNGGRGLIFPYRIAKTNNPSNFRVTYSGNWESCKNTQYKRTCPVGLNGYAISTTNKSAYINIDPNRDTNAPYYYFNKVRVFHSPSGYKLGVKNNDGIYYPDYDTLSGATVFEIKDSDFLHLEFKKPDSANERITVYGISLENDDPGFVYNAIGVNGAKLKSYLKSEHYSQQIGALNPDLVIFSIGTNDANTKYFNAEAYRIEYEQLIEITKAASPNALIMITVPNDCYMYKRYVNRNTAIVRDQIYTLAKRKNAAVWDFYSIMGGLDSSKEWYRYGLMRYDRIHFNKAGYLLKGDLFVSALLRSWEKNLTNRIVGQNHAELEITATTADEVKE